MIKAGGYATIFEPDSALVERDTITCGHCQQVIFVKPGTASTVYLIPHKPKHNKDLDALNRFDEEPGAFCRVCMSPVCLHCHDKGVCVPSEKFLEQIEKGGRRQAFLRSLGL